jgi:hypothetical protein
VSKDGARAKIARKTPDQAGREAESAGNNCRRLEIYNL